MNCYLHPDRPAVSYCRTCGRALCTSCQRVAESTVFCQEHVPVTAQQPFGGPYSGAADPANGPGGAYAASNPGFNAGPTSGANPYAQGQAPYATAPPVVPPVQTSPGLAFLLGWIPGVGAIYNGQYIKGLVHAGIFGLIVTLISSNENSAAAPFLGILLSAFVFYMPFEAYHTAKRRQAGIPVEEWSSLSRGPLPVMGGRTSVGPIILIAIGVLFLLDTMNLIEFRQIGRFWPVILIAVGASMLYSRMNPGRMPGPYPIGSSMPPPPPPGMGVPYAASASAAGNEFVKANPGDQA